MLVFDPVRDFWQPTIDSTQPRTVCVKASQQSGYKVLQTQPSHRSSPPDSPLLTNCTDALSWGSSLTMAHLRSFPPDSLTGPQSQPQLSAITQADMEIPKGTVRNAIQIFEDRIASHHYQPYAIYIHRAARNVLQLSRHTTYAERLRAAENAT
jgi:hypothetical protein